MMNNMIKLRGAKSRYLALLPVALLALALTAKAQEKNSEQEIESVKVVGMGFQKDFQIRTKGNTPDPLVLVEGEVYEDWKNIDPGIIETMTVYKADSDTVAHYSEIYEAAKYGVIMIELQEGKKQKPYKRKTVSNEEANEPYTEDMLFVYDGNVVNLSDIKDLVPEECGINGISLYHDGYYVDQYIDKYPKAKNGVVMIDSFMKNSSLFVIDGEPMNFQTMRQKYPEGLPPTKYHINHKDAETIAKYSQYPEAKNGVNIIITGKE